MLPAVEHLQALLLEQREGVYVGLYEHIAGHGCVEAPLLEGREGGPELVEHGADLVALLDGEEAGEAAGRAAAREAV